VVPAGETGDGADVADDGDGDDRADPEQPGQAGPGRGDGDRELLAGLPDPRIDAAQVIQEVRSLPWILRGENSRLDRYRR
jgi:hypothetical protein